MQRRGLFVMWSREPDGGEVLHRVRCGAGAVLRGDCGAEHGPGQKFCAECGMALAAGPVAVVSSPSIVVASDPAVVAELRFVSVLFVDLVGFTSLSEGRDAEDVRELLGGISFRHGQWLSGTAGSVQFIGDAVMAVWGDTGRA